MSRSRARKLIDDGQITVNTRFVKASLRLQKGDQVDVTLPPPSAVTLAAETMPLKILYEDIDLMVIDKPAGLTVHPAPGHYTGTLANAILAHIPNLEAGAISRPGIVHRLDKDTSGLIVVAKNPVAHMKLSDQFKSRGITKVYLALVKGHLTPEEGIIEANIGRHPRDRKRMAVVSKGREALTEYKVIEYIDNYTLLEIRPKTGRTHQIRVHLSAVGFPVVGDPIYGVRSDVLDRQFLHAYRLGFKLPSTGEYQEFQSELPDDLALALQKISANISI